MRVYVDTNIIIDHLTNRDKRGSLFFERALRGAYVIVVSDWTIFELRKNDMDASNLLMWLKANEKLELVKYTADQRDIARSQSHSSNTHFADALHIVIATDAKVDCLLTQNKRDFLSCLFAKNYTEFGIK